jgi:predicted permease
MIRDLRLGMRTLMQSKGWTTVIVVSLALGIGANTAIFSAANGLLLRKLPVHNPDELVRLGWNGRNDMMTDHSEYGDRGGREGGSTFSYPMFKQFVADNRTMTDLFASAPFGQVNLVVNGHADISRAFISTGNYYRVLGVTARIGRTLEPDDDRPSAPPAAVISHRYWQSRFGGDPGAVGKVVSVNNVPVTIVGVLPPEFTGVQQAAHEGHDIGVPLALDSQLNPGEERLSKPTYWWLQVMGRLKPGQTIAQVQANLEGTFRHTARAGLDSYLGGLTETERATSRNRTRVHMPELHVDSGSRGMYNARTSDVRATTILTVVVALVLLLVCANVANLLLSRAITRQKEISVRLSLGATRWRVIRQLLTESLVLASLGGALGIAVGSWGR